MRELAKDAIRERNGQTCPSSTDGTKKHIHCERPKLWSLVYVFEGLDSRKGQLVVWSPGSHKAHGDPHAAPSVAQQWDFSVAPLMLISHFPLTTFCQHVPLVVSETHTHTHEASTHTEEDVWPDRKCLRTLTHTQRSWAVQRASCWAQTHERAGTVLTLAVHTRVGQTLIDVWTHTQVSFSFSFSNSYIILFQLFQF